MSGPLKDGDWTGDFKCEECGETISAEEWMAYGKLCVTCLEWHHRDGWTKREQPKCPVCMGDGIKTIGHGVITIKCGACKGRGVQAFDFLNKEKIVREAVVDGEEIEVPGVEADTMKEKADDDANSGAAAEVGPVESSEKAGAGSGEDVRGTGTNKRRRSTKPKAKPKA